MKRHIHVRILLLWVLVYAYYAQNVKQVCSSYYLLHSQSDVMCIHNIVAIWCIGTK